MDNSFNESDKGFFESGPLPTESAPLESGQLALGEATQGGREERSSIVAARGTAEGLVLRIDGRVEASDLMGAVKDFLESRRSFLSGHDVAFEWIGRKPEDAVIQELTALVSSEFSISVRSSKLKTVTPKGEPSARPTAATTTTPATFSVVSSARLGTQRSESSVVEKGVSLFDGMEGLDSRGSTGNRLLWDEPDARVIYGTLRSGQKVETEHSVIVFGDVNSGAEVIAGGDIVILGSLRGIAHAGAYDESGGGRVIFSLNLQPTQLRIGLVISRGAGEERAEGGSRPGSPEIARVESSAIVVEPYQSRTVWVRRRE